MLPTTTTNPYILVALKGSQRDATPADIIQAVCEVTGILHDTIMMRKNRTKEVVTARFLAWKIIKDNTPLSLGAIGAYFNGYHHSTVLHGIECCNYSIGSDDNVEQIYNKIIKELIKISIR